MRSTASARNYLLEFIYLFGMRATPSKATSLNICAGNQLLPFDRVFECETRMGLQCSRQVNRGAGVFLNQKKVWFRDFGEGACTARRKRLGLEALCTAGTKTSPLGSEQTSEQMQHLGDGSFARRLGRPIAAIQRTMSPLRCGPSNRAFAAGAKSDHRRTGSVRNKLTIEKTVRHSKVLRAGTDAGLAAMADSPQYQGYRFLWGDESNASTDWRFDRSSLGHLFSICCVA